MKTLASIQKYFSLALVSALTVKAQVLTPGDIAIIGFNFDNPDQVAIAALAEIPSGTEIKFTDDGWQSSGSFRGSEGTFTYTAATTIAAGTVVDIGISGPALSSSGDQVLAYQGDNSSPTFIYAINSDGSSGVWQSTATSAATSALPSGLTNGTDAIAFQERDNGYYSGTTTTGTKAELLAAISDPANWTTSNSRTDSSSWPTTFTVSGGGGDPGTTTPTLSLSQSGNSTDATEGGVTDSFDVALSTLPSDDVTVTLTPDTDVDLGSGAGVAIGLNFTTVNGTSAQTVTVTAFDDSDTEDPEVSAISISTSSLDADYNGLSDQVDVNVTDNDLVPSGDLIISQYYEGTSYNKYIEVTNIGDTPIDLTSYTIVRWSDALAEEYKTAESLPAENADSLDLSSLGTIQPDQTMVFAHSSAASPLDGSSADLSGDYTSPFGFNGNDSIVIYNSPTPNPANIVDAIGFTNSGEEGKDRSFLRAGAFQGYDLNAGSNASSSQFDTVWTEITNATADAASYGDDGFIGTTALATAPTAINFTDLAIMVTEDGVSADLTVEISNPDGANSVSVDVVFNSESSTADTADISNYTTQTITFPSTAVTGEQQTVTVTITDDSDLEGIEEAIFDLSNLVTSNTNAQIGRADTATLTIQDNDAVIPDLIISEVADPNGTAGTNARFVELYNPTDSTIDLAAGNWSLVRYLATASATKQSVSLTGSISAGGTYVVARSESVFTSTYGQSPDQSNGNISGDGDDSYALFFGGNNITGTLVDLYGDIGDGSGGIDGSSTDWEYEDGRAVRNSDITSPNATFTAAEWTIYNDSASVNGTAEVADMTPGVHPDPLVAAPTGVSASTVNDTDISVAFTAVDSNDVIVVFDTDGTFTAPTGAAPSLNDSFAGGTVIYVGQASPLAHTGLSADTQYYYSVFSVNGTDYSSAVELDATTQVAGLIYSEDFDDASGDADDWFNATVTGPDPWDLSGSTASVDGYVGFVDNGAEDHYLVSPALDFSAETAITISFDYEGTYDDGDSDSFELVYSLDYSGSENPEGAATWTEIPFDFSQNLQTADPVALVNSGLISLPAALEGESVVYLAFRYSAGGGELNSEAWELDNILVQSTTVATDPVADYLTVRSLLSDDLGTDTNGNGFTVLEEYLAGFGDGSGSDVISYGIDNGATLALTLTSDLELEPVGIGVVLEATSDLGVAFVPVAFSISVVPNDGSFTRSYTETSPPAGEQRFLRLSITEE